MEIPAYFTLLLTAANATSAGVMQVLCRWWLVLEPGKHIGAYNTRCLLNAAIPSPYVTLTNLPTAR